MMVLVTLFTILVCSVTSTCLRSSRGDMMTFSAPMVPVSSGTLPVHSSTTCCFSAPTTGQATHNQVTRERADAARMALLRRGSDRPLSYLLQERYGLQFQLLDRLQIIENRLGLLAADLGVEVES